MRRNVAVALSMALDRDAETVARIWLDAASVFASDARIESLKRLIIGVRRAAAETARRDRDHEWWEALACVDNVAPTPEAVKAWVLQMAEMRADEKVETVKARLVPAEYCASMHCDCDQSDTVRDNITRAALAAHPADPVKAE